MKKLIFTSYGLTTAIGRKLIKAEIKKDGDLEDKRIFLFHEPHYSIEPLLVEACLRMGFRRENIVLSGQQKSNDELLTMDYIYVTEGNTFEILALLRERTKEELKRYIKNSPGIEEKYKCIYSVEDGKSLVLEV